LKALIKLGQTTELVKLLDDPGLAADMKLRAARHLASSKDARERASGLHYLLTNGSNLDKTMALKLVAKFKHRDLGPALLKMLADHPGELTNTILDTMVALADPSLIAPLSGFVKGSMAKRVSAAEVRLIGIQDTDFVLKLTSNKSSIVRVLAVRVLGERLKGRAAIPPNIAAALGRALKDESEDVRIAAAAALANSSDKKQLKLLVGLASDQEPRLRAVACTAASKLGGPSAKKVLLAGLTDPDDVVRIAALKGVGVLKIRESMPTLISLGNYQNPQVRRLVYQAFVQMLQPGEALKYQQFLTGGLTDRDKAVKLACLAALKGLKDRKVIAAVSDMKIDPDVEVRKLTVDVLAAAGTPDAAEALESMATIDSDSGVRVAALNALGKLNQPDIVDFLRELVKSEQDQDGDKAVIQAAKRILDELSR
jgi:HEAT repeat protein